MCRVHGDNRIPCIENGFLQREIADAASDYNNKIESQDRIIVGGHTRYAAAKQLGLEMVPYIELNHLDDMDVRKYRLADNRVADESEWDKNLLRNELAELELNSKLDAEWWKKTGFNQEEIAKVLAGTLQETKEDFKEVGESLETPHKCPKCGYAW